MKTKLLLIVVLALALAAGARAQALISSGPITLSGQNGTIIQGLHITNPTGACVTLTSSTNIIIRRSEIGPCNGNAIRISGGSGNAVYDNYIHPETLNGSGCCDHDDGIFASGTSSLTIQGNVIAYSESNIEVTGSSTVIATGNFLLNPRGPFPRGQNFQAYTGNSNITVQDNYALSSTDTSKYTFAENQEDSINFGLTNGIIAQRNYVTGGHSLSGCGIIADDGANSAQFRSNRLLNTGQCGVSIADGTNQIVDSNKVYNTTPVVGGGNTAIMTWKQYTNPCGPTTVSNNIADEIKPDGSHSGFWDGGGCSTTLSGNTFGQPADALLTPTGTVFAPPLIPPIPKDCVAVSPYTNNTTTSSCSNFTPPSTTRPNPPTGLTAVPH